MVHANALSLLAVDAVDSGGSLANAGLVIIIGVVVVFITLIALTTIFWAFGKMMDRGNKPVSFPKPAVAEPKESVTYVPPAPAPAVPTVQSGISEEVVAVIAAAVASMAPEGTKYAVRSVSRTRAERPVWAAAGIAEGTRPF